MFLITLKTEQKLFQLKDPKPVLSQTLTNVTSTKHILQLGWTKDHLRMKVSKKYCLLKFLNLPSKALYPIGDLANRFNASWRMYFVLVTFTNFCDKTGFGSVRWNKFFSVLKVTRNMLKGYLLFFISRIISSNVGKNKILWWILKFTNLEYIKNNKLSWRIFDIILLKCCCLGTIVKIESEKVYF